MTQTRLAEPRTITALSQAAACCRDCSLYRGATQVVFGEGPAPVPLILLGEQPGRCCGDESCATSSATSSRRISRSQRSW